MRADNKRVGKKGSLPKHQQFVQLINAFRQESAWLDLSFGARCLYVEMKALYNGYDNNGRIMFSARLAAEALNCNKDSATAYFKDLKQKGFIVETKGGYLGVDGRGKGRLWRLTEIGFMGDRPTKDYRKWKSEKTKPRPNSSDRVSEKPGQFPTRVSERFGQGVRKVRTEMP